MIKTRLASIGSACLLLTFNALSAYAQNDASPNADNTAINVRDKTAGEATADQAKNNPSDRAVMQKIRQEIIEDKSLSTYAQNLKIIAQNGKVTLKGPVQSDEERKKLREIAYNVAGGTNVKDEMSISDSSAVHH